MAPAARRKRVPLHTFSGQTKRTAIQGEATDATNTCVDHQCSASAAMPDADAFIPALMTLAAQPE